MTRSSEPYQAAGSLGLPRSPLSPQGVVAELGAAALNGVQPEMLFKIAVQMICNVLDLEYSTILLRDEPPSLGASWGWDDSDEVEVSLDGASSYVDFVVANPESVIVPNLTTETRFAPWPLLMGSGITCGIAVTVPGQHAGLGVLAAYSVERRRFTADDADFLRAIAHILGARMQAENIWRSQERGLRYQAALAECAHALLVGSGEDQLYRAAFALLSATDAESVFIERNVVHPELGLCSRTVAEADRPGTPAAEVDDEYDYWDLVPWEQMPMSRSVLERGEPFVVYPERLEGEEYELYAADPFPTKSELDIPIFVEGQWAGVIAFSESSVARDWADEDLSLLTAAAQMIGAFWEAEVARKRLQDLLDSKDQLIASVSHELRTPLTSVVGFARLLQMEGSDLSDEERAGVIRTIAEEGVDLANIIDDLLVAAKAESGTLAVVSVSTDLPAQVAQVMESWRPEDAARISVITSPVKATGDPARVRQILRNLISNALRYGGEDIEVRVGEEGDSARVCVSDNGSGIDLHEQERVFESYYRGEGDPGLAGSMGLGLTISRELARLMGGNLSYRYQNGESCFELSLPKLG